jgi:cephalosporin hydroxylase
MEQDSLDYAARCTDLARVVGRENVVVRRFVPGALTGGDIRVDLLALAGVDVADLAEADPTPAAAATPPPAALYEEVSPQLLRATAEHFAPRNEALRREFLPSVPAPVFATAIRPDPRFDLPLRDFYELLQEQIMHATNWMGVPMRKNPLDAWVCQEILHAVRPDVLVEIGAYVGGSTLFFAHLMDVLGHGEVVSVEVRRDRYQAEHPRIAEVTGDSRDPEVVAEVRRRCEGRRAMVVHDGDHSRETVFADLRAYADLVPIGTYVIVEDGTVDQFPVGSTLHPKKFAQGPLLAVEDFLREDDRFEVDRAMERYVVTWNPSGYLRRVR